MKGDTVADELRSSDSQFPIDVAVKKIPEEPLSAYKFADQTQGLRFAFGMDSKACADELRKIADKIESRKYILQNGKIISSAGRADYPMTVLVMTFSEGHS